MLRSVDVSDLVTVNFFIQRGLGQLLSVHTVVQQGQLVHLQVESNAQLPAEVGDELDGLESKPLLAKRGVSDPLLLFKAIDVDDNKVAFDKKESEIDIIGVPISDAEARLPTKKCKKHIRSPMARIATNFTYG